MIECECGGTYELIGRHWAANESHRPSLSEYQIDVATGVLMGDGTISRTSKNPSLKVKMITKEYLEYLDEIFGNLSTGVRKVQTAEEHVAEVRDSGFRPNASVEDYNDVYELSTRCHPDLKPLAAWYDSGKKVWPEDISLTPTVLTHLYCCDGHLANGDNITISMVNERGDKQKVAEYFSNVGLPQPSRWGEGENVCYAAWKKAESKRLFRYMNGPLPGFTYKFPC